MTALQRVLFCFTSMVTAVYRLELVGIRGLYSTVGIAVVVSMLFYARPVGREVKR